MNKIYNLDLELKRLGVDNSLSSSTDPVCLKKKVVHNELTDCQIGESQARDIFLNDLNIDLSEN